MSVLKVIEILGNSNVSFEDAVQNVINEVAKTVKNIKSVYIEDMQVSEELTLENFRKRKDRNKLMESFARLTSPML